MKSHSTMEELHNSPPPTKIARLTDNTTDMKGKEKSPPPSLIKLDLGLGGDSGGLISRTSTSSSHERTGFTFLQLKEYEHQVLIYKHMAAGIPVPFNLVLPIWKSLASSYGAFYCNNSGAFPPPYLGCKGIYFDSRNNMEPEPGRCRRTDGKKWRCSKDVVPNQKYCEKHMHRGRNRSRKPVEITTTSQVDSTTNLSISFPLQLSTTTTSATTSTNPTINSNLGCSPKSVLQNGGTSISKEPSI